MSKTHNHAYGLLNARYRSVLKKCALLNTMAAAFVAGNMSLAEAATPINIPNDTNESGANTNWDSGGNYTLANDNIALMSGGYEKYNSLPDKVYIINNGGRIEISGTLENKTNIASKLVTVDNGSLAGGFINSTVGINAVTGGTDGYNLISLSNSQIDASGVSVTLSGSSRSAIINGGIIAVTGKDSVSSIYKSLSISDNTSFTGNFIYIEDNTGSESASTVEANGGVIYNIGSAAMNGISWGVTFKDNKITLEAGNGGKDSTQYIARGAAIYNAGEMSVAGGKFEGNAIIADYGYGGSVYNLNAEDDSSFSLADSSFSGNSLTVSKEGMGGAVYNSALNGETVTISNSSFTNNVITVKNTDESVTVKAYGAGVYNNGSESAVSTLEIKTDGGTGKNVVFTGNKIDSSAAAEGTVDSRGGAVYNGRQGALILTADSGHSIIMQENKADKGGAIYNEADNAMGNNSLQITSTGGGITLNKNEAEDGAGIYNGESGMVTIDLGTGGKLANNENTASGKGGAFYNSENGKIEITFAKGAQLEANYNTAAAGAGMYNNAGTISMTGNGALTTAINWNKAEAGAAVYNINGGEISMNYTDSDMVVLKENEASIGGAVYNSGSTLTISTSSTESDSSSTHGIGFGNNRASLGGAIYNTQEGVLNFSAGDESGIIFTENQAADKGGAIYNDYNSNINFTLGQGTSLTFETAGDSIYNLGSINIEGAGNSIMQLNSSLDGMGNFIADGLIANIENGTINGAQKLSFTNSTINLNGSSILNVDGTDNLSGANLNVSADSVVNYAGTESTPDMVLADTMSHAGVLNLNDGVLSTITVKNYEGQNGWIYIDVNPQTSESDTFAVTDVISGTTNFVFEGIDYVTTEEGKLVFARTNAEVPLDEYEFIFNTDNSVFIIELGRQEHEGMYDWYLYRSGAVRTEVLNYIILPRAAVEQTRSILVDASRNDNTPRVRYEYGYRNNLRKVVDKNTKVSLWANPVYRFSTFKNPSEIDGKIWGVDFGLNANTSADSKTGFLVSYRKGNYDNGGSSGKYFAYGSREMELTSTLVGLYYSKYFGNMHINTMIYGGEQKARMNTDEDIFASTKGTAAGVQFEAEYTARMNSRQTISPGLKLSYDYVKFDDITDVLGKKVTYEDIHDIEIELGVKFEHQFNNEHQLPTTAYIKPSVVQLIENGGEATVKNIKFDDTLKNETAGRIEIGGEATLMPNFTIGGFGNYTLGSDYNGFAVGGNMRYTW